MTALTDKYRPKKLSQVVGQKAAVNVVKGMIDKGIPPTILLNGPRSTGKTTIARILARRINCQEPDGYEPCGKCASCKQTKHPDVLELNAADERGIGTIRRLQSVSVLAPRFEKRVIIMDECHALTPQAYQASLKLFEEPPKSCCFLLVTTNPEKMPQTILSRCSPIGLRKIAESVLTKYMMHVAKREQFDLDEESARYLASAADGHPREALTYLQQLISHPDSDKEDLTPVVQAVTNTASNKMVADFVTALMKGNAGACFKMYGQIDEPDKFITSVVEMLQALVRMLIDPKMVNPFYATQLKALRKAKLEDAIVCLEEFGHAMQQAKSYIMPADVVLDLAILKATG
ncbi:MAG: AAA family ATPase [Anaerolineae bacterium]|nr:AAA family ATPase [Thermoplasmata archaeon]NIV34220.1 AAA family ATPase [Anaerolineae bacterium]NIY06068.1 AAA family ATPase [Thermoplasmata archaeon]